MLRSVRLLTDDDAARLVLDPAVVDDPYPFYRRLREEAPVWRVPNTSIVMVASFEAINEVVARPGDFSSNLRGLIYRGADDLPMVAPFGGDFTDALATADPPLHAVHRGAVFPTLMNRRMAELRPEVDRLARHHIAEALADDHVEFMRSVANAIPIRVVSRLIGFEGEDPDQLLAAAFDSTAMLSAVLTQAEVEAAAVRTAVVAGWLAEQLQRAVDDGADGILGTVAGAVAADEIDFATGLVMLHTLLSAGGESTTGLIGNAACILADDPDLQDRLRRDPDLVTPFLEEVLRLESPFRHHQRHAPRATTLRGVTVEGGSTLLLLWGSANRDPAEFDRPDEVVLDRAAPRHHLAFGRGIHLCVGAPLARLEADIVLRRFLGMTDSFTRDPAARPEREPSLMVRRFRTLPLLVRGSGTDPS